MVQRWSFWAELHDVSLKELGDWENDSDRKYHCVFCNRHFTAKELKAKPEEKMVVCPHCKSHKSMEPCIPNKCTTIGK